MRIRENIASMTREKVKIAWIANDTARKASLKKRRTGLCKKVQELTTLCGINAFVIIYSPDEAEPMIWPSRSEVVEMMAEFQSIPELKRFKKMMNLDSYLRERISKIEQQKMKESKKKREGELSLLMNKLKVHDFDYNCLEPTEKRYLALLIGERRDDIKKRIGYIEQTHPLVPVVQPGAEVAPGPPRLPRPRFEERVQQEAGVFRANPIGSMMRDQWFLDMVRKSDNVAGGSGSGSGAPPPLPPQGYQIGGDVGALGLCLGLSSTEGNPYFDLSITTPPNPNPSAIGAIGGDFGGSSSNSNANFLGFDPIQPPATVSSGAKLFGYLVGLPWPPNTSP
ncbi:MADS-box transcription factor PHERES 1-like [Euphorbia lathyris]|uniref:MADS-box transcription factor PHERES 1-like n=1 Tax=Euphorbia lathyris TaxID=212925 RepID=UPI003313C848